MASDQNIPDLSKRRNQKKENEQRGGGATLSGSFQQLGTAFDASVRAAGNAAARLIPAAHRAKALKVGT
ncbi:MAG: hypothetical protein ABIJ96_00005, partial [Elusimicrobiota bacterium]